MKIHDYDVLLLSIDSTPNAKKLLKQETNRQATISEFADLAHSDLRKYLKKFPDVTVMTDGYLYTRRDEKDKFCLVIYFTISPDTKQITHNVNISTLNEAVAFSKKQSGNYPMLDISIEPSFPSVMPSSKPEDEEE